MDLFIYSAATLLTVFLCTCTTLDSSKASLLQISIVYMYYTVYTVMVLVI